VLRDAEDFRAPHPAFPASPERGGRIARLERNSFEASFLPAAQKQAWAAKVDAFAASGGSRPLR
jgi:hypothetical protein